MSGLFFLNNLLLPLINHINLHSLFDSDLTTTQLCQLDKINSIGTRFSAFGNSPFLGISNILVFFSCNRTSVLLIKKKSECILITYQVLWIIATFCCFLFPVLLWKLMFNFNALPADTLSINSIFSQFFSILSLGYLCLYFWWVVAWHTWQRGVYQLWYPVHSLVKRFW